MKLTFAMLCMSLAAAQVAPANAQTFSPVGHYAKKRGGAGDLKVEADAAGLRILISAAGAPNGAATAADCTVIAIGALKDKIFRGDIAYKLDTPDEKPGPENAVPAGHNIIVGFTPNSATVSRSDVADLCGMGSDPTGRYAKSRK